MSTIIEKTNIGRYPILDVNPVFESGRFAAKAIENEVLPITAKIFGEGHDKIGATVVLQDPDGNVHAEYLMQQVGYDADKNWNCLVQVGKTLGLWHFYIEAWLDAYHTWEHHAKIKVPSNQDVELTLAQGSQIFSAWSKQKDVPTALKKVLAPIVSDLLNTSLSPEERLFRATASNIQEIALSHPFRQYISKSKKYPIAVDRRLSSFSAWYQFFPRSEGAKQKKDGTWISGTFTTASKRLQAVKNMGFDIIYMPPIHPIGTTFRKGANNTLHAKDHEPGSPWAVGSSEGGHDVIHPELGTIRTFKSFIKRANELDLEVSLDIALQCSPDHPWVKEHPNWFTHRPDGTIAYAENPPKKYQDIYPINFDNEPDQIVEEVLRILHFWIDLGVTVLRIDNPHTKPVWFWEVVIKRIKETNPEVIWLAEAFTNPIAMKTLGLIGYDQSHSYFLWRNNKYELTEFLGQINDYDAFWYRATLWPTTPDNLTDYLANGGTAAHAIRAVLAAMGSTTWGIYAGYELVENIQRQNPDGSHALEHVDSEKYQFKQRNWKDVSKYGISDFITTLNRIRNNHVSCQNMHNLQVHTTTNDNIIAFSRHISGSFTTDGKDDTLITIVNLDPHHAHQAMVYLDYGALNLPERYEAVDEVTGNYFELGRSIYVDLAPVISVAHIFHIKR
ncbi:MAG: DUF3416 domain-containing protein [Candidatus Ancillula sp.]|jgi:starch synthase (maltosyl-transferring)|nr:DUF3416 domain-containing protein [Candidatus Ancillula sp.]